MNFYVTKMECAVSISFSLSLFPSIVHDERERARARSSCTIEGKRERKTIFLFLIKNMIKVYLNYN